MDESENITLEESYQIQKGTYYLYQNKIKKKSTYYLVLFIGNPRKEKSPL